VLPDSFGGMGAWRNSTETNSLATLQGLDQKSKMEEVVPNMAHWRGSDVGQSRRRSRRLNVVMRSPPLYPRGGPK